MSHPLSKYSRKVVSPTKHSDKYRQVIEEHLKILREQNSTRIPISADANTRYIGDMDGLMTELNIRYDDMWTVMRVNGFMSPSDYTGDLDSLIIPSANLLDKLLQRIKARSKRI